MEPLNDVNPILSLRGIFLMDFNHDFIRFIFQIIFSLIFQSPFSILVICSNFQIFKFFSFIFSEFKFWVKDYRIKFYRLSRCSNLRRFLALLVCFPSCPPNNTILLIIWANEYEFLNSKCYEEMLILEVCIFKFAVRDYLSASTSHHYLWI